ncbi:MAG: helix-turn-helix domain-containing protein [Azoarcus sp.]|jgi:transcriptional regulator with XRE-family HTH domain|nr:helix-turn-helix domain-containing protein [Azoarcus sp.]
MPLCVASFVSVHFYSPIVVRSGSSRAEICRRADISTESLRRYENGQVGMLAEFVAIIAASCGIDVLTGVKDGDAWRKRKYAYIKINSKDDPGIVDRYIARYFRANNLSEFDNAQLEQTYRYVAGRKARK